MKKIKVFIAEGSIKSSKDKLFERLIKYNSSFKINLNENDNKLLYKRILSESTKIGANFDSLTEHFINHNKLSGNLDKDKKFLKEFYLLLEDDDFDPFGHLELNDKIDEKEDCLLTISKSNEKINHPFFSLPAGYTCPFADICKSFASKTGDKFASSGKNIKDHGDIRCYAASAEVAYPNVRKSRWRNFDLLKEFKGDVAGMTDLIDRSLQNFGSMKLFRIHESGDFYSQEYFDAWLGVIRKYPNVKFYAYTKAIPYWISRLNEIPENFKLTASRGGKYDNLIDEYGLKQAVIVNTPEEAKKMGLPIDVDDSLAYNSDDSFALLLHGVQSKESGLTPQARKNSQLLKQIKKRRKI